MFALPVGHPIRHWARVVLYRVVGGSVLRRLKRSAAPVAIHETVAYWDGELSGRMSHPGLNARISNALRDTTAALLIKECGTKPTSVLDLGCGFGDLTHKLADQGMERYVGVDLSEFVIDRNRREAPSWPISRTARLRFHRDDLRRFQPEEQDQFDVIVFNEVLKYVEVDEAVAQLTRYRTWLAPDGICCVNITDDPKCRAIFRALDAHFTWVYGTVYQQRPHGPKYKLTLNNETPAYLVGLFRLDPPARTGRVPATKPGGKQLGTTAARPSGIRGEEVRRSGPYGRRGLLVRLGYLVLALLLWLMTGFGRLGRCGTLTLCYHGVTARQAASFRWQMRWITRRASATDAPRAQRWGRRRRPPIQITFDDAFANLSEHALPATTELGIPTRVFAVSGNLGRRPAWNIDATHPDAAEITMTAEQLTRIASDFDCTIGSHSLTHARLTELPDDRAVAEMTRSRTSLEAIVAKPVLDFAFPYGASSPSLVRSALAAGYERVFTADWSGHDRDASGTVVGRTAMSPDAWPIEFALTAAGAYRWLPVLRRCLRSALASHDAPTACPHVAVR